MRKRNEMSDAETETCMAPGQDPAERDSQFVTALARGLDVLRAFHPKDGALGNQQLAERTGLPKPTVSRLTYTLSRLGYLTHLPEVGKYLLGAGVLSLGFTCLGAMGIRQIARPFMQELADYSGVSVALGSRDRLSMAYVECCRGDSAITLALNVGSHIKLGTSAMGRAFLAGLPAVEREQLYDQLAAHEGDRWMTVKRGIEQAQADVAERGFSISAGEWKSEVNAVGVPLRVGEGGLAFALNCGGPAYKLPFDRLVDDIGPRLVAVADKVRQAMGLD
jgi:DNA-binding IclR family transcriptional regulator